MRNTIVLEQDEQGDFRGVNNRTKPFMLCAFGMSQMFGGGIEYAKRIKLQFTIKKQKGAVQVELAKPARNKRVVREVVSLGGETGEEVSRLEGLWLGSLFSKKAWERYGYMEKETVWNKGPDRYQRLPVWVTVTVLEDFDD